jgi:predicted RNA polymerase sigma factor
VGPYALQAAIAALHDETPSTDATDWPQILALYGLLARMDGSPMVLLNIAIATAMVHGAKAGLAKLDAIADDPRLREGHRLDAVRAHLLERAGDLDAAFVHYERASERTASTPERDYLRMRASRVRAAI